MVLNGIARGAGGSRVEAPAPVAAYLIDASDDIVRTLRAWALYVQFGEGHPWRVEGLEVTLLPKAVGLLGASRTFENAP